MTEISDEELASLTAAIKNRFDIDFTGYEKKSLKRGFARLIVRNKLKDLMELWEKVLFEEGFFMSVVDDLTVNLTELFRNPELWSFIKTNVLTEFKGKFQLKMMHAGCSSGEEIYSMAMVLKDTHFLSKSKSYAYDLSGSIIEKAKAGRYNKALWTKYGRAFKQYFPNRDVSDFFTEEGNELVVKDELRRHITFKQLNLVSDILNRGNDIIFCRNVLIYFDEALKMKILKKFYDALNDDGFFIIGYYDVLPSDAHDLFQVYDAKTRVYIKKLK